ncbi:MAG: DUF4058 family protein [Nodosilinea sp.]
MPYLEHSDFWPEVHHWLITLIAETLVPQVRLNWSWSICRLYLPPFMIAAGLTVF